MLQGQISPGQMSLWQLEIVQDGSRNLPLKFGQNRVSNSWDMLCLNYLPGWVGGENGNKAISASIGVEVELSWVEAELGKNSTKGEGVSNGRFFTKEKKQQKELA